MFNISTNVRNLSLVSFLGFVLLSTLVAIIPAAQMQGIQPLPGMEPLTEAEKAGLSVFVAEDCMACHTQQVRSIEMDNMWGSRPSIPADYYYNKKRMNVWQQSPSTLGSERTGPDLTNIGLRQPSDEWHLLHLYNPRLVVSASIMPSYPWMFEEKSPDQVTSKDVVVNVPAEYLKNPDNKVVAKQKALDLVAYLKYLKQPKLPDGREVNFIPSTLITKEESGGASADGLPNGEDLYMKTCAVCHQDNGTGLPGAFPSLAGSSIVNDKNYRMMAAIILKGYDARPEYAAMPGHEDQLDDAQIAAIMNHERSSWGNDAPAVTADQVKAVRDSLN